MHPNSLKTHCKKGHEFTPDNTFTKKNGWRECITCKREWGRQSAARRSSERRQELNSYSRQWRLANLEKSQMTARQSYEKIRNLIEKTKNVPCADCGERFPHYVMDFHHRDPNDKGFNVGKSRSLNRLESEMAKCDVICSNCHRIRTWKDVQRKSVEL